LATFVFQQCVRYYIIFTAFDTRSQRIERLQQND